MISSSHLIASPSADDVSQLNFLEVKYLKVYMNTFETCSLNSFGNPINIIGFAITDE